MSVLTTAKTVTVKVGRAERRVVRVQRRIWLAQILLWPTLLTAGVVGAVVLARRWGARRPAEPPRPPGDDQLG
ncbi:MAG: hypothetical protein ABWY45_14920 [Mycobacterium sp.]